MLDPQFDGLDESRQASEHEATQHPVGGFVEPALHQI
jgi:hypothetical protein